MSPLPSFENPPVIEVACGVQFRPVEALRGMRRHALYDNWRQRFPQVSEQPPIPPLLEASSFGSPSVQMMLNPQDVRHWFLDDAGCNLVQLQQDRLIVNWREGDQAEPYPRFPAVRGNFAARLSELEDYVQNADGEKLEIISTEVSYINSISDPGEILGGLDGLVRDWPGFSWHHLGRPDATRAAFEFPATDMGSGVRLTVSFAPGVRITGEASLFMTLSVQGRPSGAGLESTLSFVDRAHEHIVKSFQEFTTPERHAQWGVLQ